jgi:tetratricopeptide (TPR) repeat protein
MVLADQLRALEAAQGDEAALALAAVDLGYPDLPEAERQAIKDALEAAAVPHWFDRSILAALLDIPFGEAAARLVQLRALRVVEPFPARGESALNVHEAARLALRRRLAESNWNGLCLRSARAAACFAQDPGPAGRVEWIFHLLIADPDRGASELEALHRAWVGRACPEDRFALASALKELKAAGLTQGRARVWLILVEAWTRVSRGESARLEDDAREALHLAQGDRSAEAEALCLLGDVFEAQGRLEDAQAAYVQSLAICRRLTDEAPGNEGWQRELAVAYSRVGDMHQAQGKLDAADAAFREYLAIVRRLAERDPENAGWQRDLAVAWGRLGDLLLSDGKPEGAKAAYTEDLEIARRMAGLDLGNAGWQRELAVAHAKLADALYAQGGLEEAHAAYTETLAICRALAERDGSNAVWRKDLAVAHGRVGNVLKAQGRLEEARVEYGVFQAICRDLVEQDPSNAEWRRDLALATQRLANIEARIGRTEVALRLFEDSVGLFDALMALSRGNAQWVSERKLAKSELERLRSAGPAAESTGQS